MPFHDAWTVRRTLGISWLEYRRMPPAVINYWLLYAQFEPLVEPGGLRCPWAAQEG